MKEGNHEINIPPGFQESINSYMHCLIKVFPQDTRKTFPLP